MALGVCPRRYSSAFLSTSSQSESYSVKSSMTSSPSDSEPDSSSVGTGETSGESKSDQRRSAQCGKKVNHHAHEGYDKMKRALDQHVALQEVHARIFMLFECFRACVCEQLVQSTTSRTRLLGQTSCSLV